jgi:hypothetical protein
MKVSICFLRVVGFDGTSVYGGLRDLGYNLDAVEHKSNAMWAWKVRVLDKI